MRKPATILQQRLPFAGLFGAAVAGIAVSQWLPLGSQVFLAAGLGGLFLWGVVHRTAWVLMAVAGAFATVHVWQTRESPMQRLADGLGGGRVLAVVSGAVADEPAPYGSKRSRFVLRVESIERDGVAVPVPGEVLVLVSGQPPRRGDVVRATGSLLAIPPARNPAQFDSREWMGLRDITCQLEISAPADLTVTKPAGGFSLPRIADECRRWMQQTLRLGISDDPVVCDLIAGMVLRVTSAIPESLQNDFRDTGTYHLFAVSGLHVGMVGVILWQLLQILGVRRRAAIALIIPAIFFYVLLTGWKSASIRAAFMASVVLIGMAATLRPISFNSFCAAGFFILLQATSELFNPGFQFSFVVVGAILLLIGPIHRAIRAVCHPDPFLPRKIWTRWEGVRAGMAENLGGMVAVSTAAWIGSLPLTVVHFHMVSFSALPTNFLIIPIAFAILSTAVMSVLGGLVWGQLASVFNNANWAFTKVLLAVVQAATALPGSHFYATFPDVFPARVTVTVFDFPDGGAVGIEAGGKLWLVDCGSAWETASVIEPWVHSRGHAGPDGLVLTHGDARHIGGAQDMVFRARPGLIVESVLKDRSAKRSELHRTLEALGMPKSLLRPGDRILIAPGASLSALHPPAGFVPTEADDRALVLRLDAEGARILLLSDAGPPTEQRLLETLASELPADIVIAGRHSSKLPIDGTFLDAVRPGVLIRSATGFPSADLDRETLYLTHSRGIRFIDQSQSGAVIVKIYKNSLSIREFLAPDNGENRRHFEEKRTP